MVTQIKHEAYSVYTNEFGWAVVNTTSRINNIGRAYQVWAGDDGRPVKCSCPSWHHRQLPCKHMVAIAAYIDAHPVEIKVGTLEHPVKAKCFRFAGLSNGMVSYQCWEAGRLTRDLVITREDAKNRWGHLYRLGYRQFGAMSKSK